MVLAPSVPKGGLVLFTHNWEACRFLTHKLWLLLQLELIAPSKLSGLGFKEFPSPYIHLVGVW
nr:MAG TPA: hypothetical protein [Caudoviricetes sp.]